MSNFNNIKLWTTPVTGRVELISVNAKGIVTARRTLSEIEICDYLVQLIEYMRKNGADTITNPTTGEKWIFGQEKQIREKILSAHMIIQSKDREAFHNKEKESEEIIEKLLDDESPRGKILRQMLKDKQNK